MFYVKHCGHEIATHEFPGGFIEAKGVLICTQTEIGRYLVTYSLS